MLITERDLDMLSSLAEAGYLTPLAMSWLHFPTHSNKLSTRLYTRLKKLHDATFVTRMVRTVATGREYAGRAPDVYMLTDKGAYLLAERRGLDLDTMIYQRERPRSTLMLHHYIQSATVYAALRARIERMESVTMLEWQSEHRTTKSYDQVSVRRKNSHGGTEVVKLPVQPDGTFLLDYHGTSWRVFLEVDRGTRRIETWREKIAAYKAYDRSSELMARYGAQTFLLLITCPSPLYRQRLMEATALELGTPNGRYLFCCESDVNPQRIGDQWHKIKHIHVETRQGVTKKAYQRAVVETEQHTLFH